MHLIGSSVGHSLLPHSSFPFAEVTLGSTCTQTSSTSPGGTASILHHSVEKGHSDKELLLYVPQIH